ncbi:MAG: hypothetical protein M5R36_09560 [Deltaproteobacteria bacterium]|nr:hypothetical protein [Deltaproteobacteria bacterium]
MSDDARASIPRFDPPEPSPPRKTWRGTVVIAAAVAVFAAIIVFINYRWADLQTFSPELRFEGYHYFSGTLLPPEPLFASDLIKLRIRTDDGEELVLPAVPEVGTDAPKLASYPEGACVEGFARHHRGFLEEISITVDGRNYYLVEKAGWIVTEANE